MGRPRGTTNIMRTPKEKETIVKRYLNGETILKLADEIGTTKGVIRCWARKYEQEGIKGLNSKTGKTKKPGNTLIGKISKKNKTREEELELKLMMKDIEIARLKKGYMVKGVGAEKEYITTFNKNTK